MGRVFDTESLDWQPLRPEAAEGILGKTLLSAGVKVVLTNVAPKGRFRPHRDSYGHLFYILAGEGRVLIGDDSFLLRPGSVVQIEAGENHAYENTGSDELLLISLNLPVT